MIHDALVDNVKWRIDQRTPSVLKRSLLDDAYCFERNRAKGAIFFMPSDGEFSGDAFEVEQSDGEILTTIVSDAIGHGTPAYY